MPKILLVDDETNLRHVTAAALRKAGYVVSEAANTQNALEMLAADFPDLIISDICMEGGDGISFLERVRATERTASLPFIFISGHADQETMRIGAEHAVDAILPKPFTFQTLIATIDGRLKRESGLRMDVEAVKVQLQRILEASPDLIGIIEPKTGYFRFLNVMGRKMLGIPESVDITHWRLESFYAPDKVEELIETVLPRALSDGLYQSETMLKRLSGETFPVKQYVQAHTESAGHLSYLSLIAHDLSESQRLEEERKSMQLQLIQAQKLESIGQMAAGIAHEINTPTQYIADNTRFLQQSFADLSTLLSEFDAFLAVARLGPVPAEAVNGLQDAVEKADLPYLLAEIPRAIEQSLEGLDRVTKIVRAMKDFSHPGVVDKTLVDINHAIQSTITVAKNEWKYVADLELALDPALPLVSCVPGEINQVILNLLVNAAHAIEEQIQRGSFSKGRITVRTRQTRDSFAEISIEDTGAGIPIAVQQKIFEPFFTTKQVGKGTGQGLAIARSVTAKHHGSIHFESHVGRGTTFFVRLPLSAELSSPAAR
jgi:two-component system, NtrC family, sensor kinase